MAYDQPGADVGLNPEPFVCTMNDIGVTQHWIVTPVGTVRVEGSHWTIRENVQLQRVIPGWAIAAAILLIPCTAGLSLLFLAVKTDVVYGNVEISVHAPGLVYSTTIPVGSLMTVGEWRRCVHGVQQLASRRY